MRLPTFFLSRIFPTLLLAFAMGAAHADDYGDVNALLRQGKAAEALAKADAYIAGNPRDPQMRFLRAVILAEQGRQDDAIAALTQLTQDFPALPEPHNNLAALYAAQGQFDKARAALETAIRLNPDYATAHENLGDVYARLAAQAYSRAKQLEPGNVTVPPKLALIRELFDAPARK
jgi:Flp pilus assembly protein TadD